MYRLQAHVPTALQGYVDLAVVDQPPSAFVEAPLYVECLELN